jgi:hypothetical protein
MPRWLNKRAVLIGVLFGGYGNFNSLSTSGYSTEGWVGVIVGALVGGLFWGWVLTKFVPKWFPAGE